ncbi:hypothetical protein ACIGQE_27580 [Streptomyces sp. NPDC053429]|uniref:hypothetical protein n=1 Tax=Streptomyces sp. NPDC053429 TaxID=3365702 RepID=UPI0037CE5C37
MTTGEPGNDRTPPRLGDAQIEERLRSLPGAEGVRARALSQANMTGQNQPVFADFYRGDDSVYDHSIVKGRAPKAAGEIVAGPAFLTPHGLMLGDRVTLELNGRKITATSWVSS